MISFTIKCPKCGSQARKNMGGVATTLTYVPETYDREGKIVFQPDPNIYIVHWSCTDCGCNYSSEVENGKMVIKDGWTL